MSTFPHRVKILFYSGWWIPLGDDRYQAENGAVWNIPNAKIIQETAY